MELKFLTPTEVWNNFNASEVTLESSTVSTENGDDLVCLKQYFKAQENAQGTIRAYMEIYYDKRWTGVRPAILLLDSYVNTDSKAMALALVKNGYIVGLADYCGKLTQGGKTEFTQNLKFAEYPECTLNLKTVRKNARNSPWFVWSKIARCAISVLELLPLTDKAHIGIIGFGEGAHIAWQVTGIDGRIRALVAVGDTGYRCWTGVKSRFSGANVMSTDEELVFSSGVGAETYAKFIHCPTLLIVAKSAYSTDADRAGDILSLVPSQSKQLLITNGNDIQLTKYAYDAMLLWLKNNFVAIPTFTVNPVASFENVDGKLYLRLNTVLSANKIRVFVCYGEANSNSRHWDELYDLQKVDADMYTVGVPVYDANELIVAYATVEYEDKMPVSTPIMGLTPSKLGITEIAQIRDTYHLMYDGSMGLGSFLCVAKGAVADESALQQAIGPFDIKGITVTAGGLSLCRSAAELKALDRTSTLHFDAYSPVARELRVNMYAYPEMKRYVAKVQLNGGEFWQKIVFQSADFKSDEGKTLSQFSATKILAIPDMAGVILNNFLWI